MPMNDIGISRTPARKPTAAAAAILRWDRLHISLALAGLGLLAALLLTVNIASFPAPWFDEGLNLSTAATLARAGLYALPDSAGPRVMDPAIQTGPLLVVPIALVYQLFGAGIVQARLIMIVFAIGALLAYALLARRLVGGRAALLALLLLLAGNDNIYTSFIPMARQTLGEVTALGLILYGIYLWLRLHVRPGQPSAAALVLVGLAFGLGMATKSQVLVVFPVAWGALCLLDRFYYRQASWRAFLVPGTVALAPVAAWYLAQRMMVSQAQFQEHVATLREGFGIHIISFSLANMRQALGALWHSGFLLWGLPGAIYGLYQARERSARGLAHASLLLFMLLWLLWFVCGSIGWARYAFVTLALAPIWSAQLLLDALAAPRWGALGRARLGKLALGLGALLLLAYNAQTTVQGVFGEQQRDFQQFSAYLSANVPAGATVESWEWELDLAAPQRFHHPPTHTTNLATLNLLREPPVPLSYDPGAAQPAYLIDGPFSSWIGIYRTFIAERCTRVETIGGYTLYRVVR